MNRKRILDILFIICFAMMLIIPVLFTDWKGGAISETENRMLAKAPVLSFKNGKKYGVKMYCNEFNDWINDNIGGRNIASNIITETYYYAFNESAKSDNVIGKEDWIFYVNGDILADYTHANLYTQSKLDTYTDALKNFDDYCKSRNIEFLFILLPDKKTVYSEYYIDGLTEGKGISRSEQLINSIDAAEINNLWLYNNLMNAKTEGILYSKKLDAAHWNTLGAYVGYRSILEYFESIGYDGAMNIVDYYDIKEKTDKGIFNGCVDIEEVSYDINCTDQSLYDIEADPKWFDDIEGMTYSGTPELYKIRYINKNSTGPKVVYIGDSYSLCLMQYMKYSCSEFTMVHVADIPYEKDVIEKANPDVVIYENVERMLPFLDNFSAYN